MTEWSRISLDLVKDKVKRKTRSNVFNLLVKSQIFPLQKMLKIHIFTKESYPLYGGSMFKKLFKCILGIRISSF